MYGSVFPLINTSRPPFDDVRVRYALNMATPKRVVADFIAGGRTPAANLVPPLDGYPAPSELRILIDGKEFDVLSYNPVAARELFTAAMRGKRVRVQFLIPNLPEARPIAQILQQEMETQSGHRIGFNYSGTSDVAPDCLQQDVRGCGVLGRHQRIHRSCLVSRPVHDDVRGQWHGVVRFAL